MPLRHTRVIYPFLEYGEYRAAAPREFAYLVFLPSAIRGLFRSLSSLQHLISSLLNFKFSEFKLNVELIA